MTDDSRRLNLVVAATRPWQKAGISHRYYLPIYVAAFAAASVIAGAFWLSACVK